MKIIIITLLLISSNCIIAQQSLDTIYANDTKNVALFFPETIRQGITGNSNFVFTYNREREQYFGLLQATPGTESNLLAITNNGKIYSYILKYKKHLLNLNYFITENECIGIEEPEKSKSEHVHKPTIEKRIQYFQKFSNYLLKSNYVPMATSLKKGIKLQLQKMTYNASEVYLVLKIKNKSEIDFEIDYLKIYRTNGNTKRKASYQSVPQDVIYKYKKPSIVLNGKFKRFIYVLPKFVLGDNESLQIELKELNGSRKIILKTKIE